MLSERLKQSLGKPVELEVYSMLTQEIRKVEVIPQATSEQILIADKLSSKDLIGVELKFEKYTDVHEMVYLVDNVQKGSPAEEAGLGTGEGHDYVIGSPQNLRFESISELSEYLYSNNKKQCSLLVYNTR